MAGTATMEARSSWMLGPGRPHLLSVLLLLLNLLGHGAVSLAAPAAAAGAGSSRASMADQILKCYGVDADAAPLTFDAYASGKPSRIHAVTALWSSKPGQEKAPLTVVTAVTKDRVDNLRAQCAAWPGPLVAVFYTGLSPKEWEQFRARLGANKQSGGRKAAEEGLGSLFNIGLGQEAGQVNATAAGSEQQAGKGSGGGLDAGQAERMAEEEAALGTARKLLLVHSNKAAGAASQQQAARPAHRLDDALVATRELFAWAEAQGEAACALRLILAVEPVQDPVLIDLLPINALRNLAMLAADTPLVVMLDVDMLPSSTLAKQLLGITPGERREEAMHRQNLEVAQPGHAEAKLPQAGPKIPATTAAGAAAGAGAGASRLSAVSEEARRKLLVTSIASLSDAEGSVTLDNIMRACKDGSIIILPALEQTFDRKGGIPPHVLAEANAYVKDTKQGIVKAMDEGHLQQFLLNSFMPAQVVTNYNQWKKTKRPYRIHWRKYYEPWYIMERVRFHDLYYDIRFRGGEMDKISQVAAASRANLTFVVHGTAWLIHRPHPIKAAREVLWDTEKLKQAKEDPSVTNFLEIADRFRELVLSNFESVWLDAKKSRYNPVVEEPFLRCMGALPWWQKHAPAVDARPEDEDEPAQDVDVGEEEEEGEGALPKQ